MFRFFENLVDPFSPFTPNDTPPRRLIPFLAEYARLFRRVFVATGIFSMLNAFSEVILI